MLKYPLATERSRPLLRLQSNCGQTMVPSNLTLSAFYYSLLWVQTQNIKLNTLASATIPLQHLPRNLFRGASSLSPKHQTNLIYFKKLIQASSFGTLYQSLSLQCSRALKFAFLLSFFLLKIKFFLTLKYPYYGFLSLYSSKFFLISLPIWIHFFSDSH